MVAVHAAVHARFMQRSGWIARRLVALLLGRHCTTGYAIQHARGEAPHQAHGLGATTDIDVALLVRGGVEDGACDLLGWINRWRQLRFAIHIVSRVLRI